MWVSLSDEGGEIFFSELRFSSEQAAIWWEREMEANVMELFAESRVLILILRD